MGGCSGERRDLPVRLASACGARSPASEMDSPGDNLRSQAEVRLARLVKKVAAHAKTKDFHGAAEAKEAIVALKSVIEYIDETYKTRCLVKFKIDEYGLDMRRSRRSTESPWWR